MTSPENQTAIESIFWAFKEEKKGGANSLQNTISYSCLEICWCFFYATVTLTLALLDDWSVAVNVYPPFTVLDGIWTCAENCPVASLVVVAVSVTAPRVKVTLLFAAKPVPVTVIVDPGATENSGFAVM